MKYASLKQNTWIYRRHYPADIRTVLKLGALKQSLKTGDIAVAKARVAELNAYFEDVVMRVRAGLELAGQKPNWTKDLQAAIRSVDWVPPSLHDQRRSEPVGPLGDKYLRMQSKRLASGGIKSVRYSVDLFLSRHKDDLVGSLNREDGKRFLGDIAQPSATLGKSSRYHGRSLEVLLAASRGCNKRIKVVTQRRIWFEVKGFLDWVVYEGHLGANPFHTVRFEGRGDGANYAVPEDYEVRLLLKHCHDERLRALLKLCLLTGMRLGEARGLLREDLREKGALGTFALIRPNQLRGLKTASAEREVPLHSSLNSVLQALPPAGPLFPRISVNMMTKAFAKLRERVCLEHLVFHGTRKWFTTQCERLGVPEHFTASLVGHQSARSSNGMTYAIFSGGISDAQKREIIDQLRLPQ